MSRPGDEIVEPIQILRELKKYENAYGALFDDDVRFTRSGADGHYLRWQWAAPYSVAVLAVEGSDALLIRSFRHSARRETVELVKGFGAAGRDPETVALTELEEELGFVADNIAPVGVVVTDPGFAWHPLHCFVACGRIATTPRVEHSEAIVGVERVPLPLPADAALDVTSDLVTLFLLMQVSSRGGNS